MALRFFTVIALAVLGMLLPTTASFAAPAANDHTVLILGSTVTGGALSMEAQAVPAGFDVEVASDADWAAKTQADFATYRVIILGDPSCPPPGLDPVAAAIANAATWNAAVDGKVLVVGTDPIFHAPYQPGAALMVTNMVEYIVNSSIPGQTSALVMLSCYYNEAGAGNVVDMLSGLGTFIVSDNDCYPETHIAMPSHPSMAGLTDAAISYWDCPMHALFTEWPADFDVVAMSKGLGSEFIAEDGQVGTPYILFRTEGVIEEEPCEELPTITLGDVTPDTLWSPNKKMIDITVDATVTGQGVNVTRTITCSETPKAPWTVFYEDGADIWHFKLRADRNGAADPTVHSPRIYTITYEGTDECGNVVSAVTYVIVPHDQKSKKK